MLIIKFEHNFRHCRPRSRWMRTSLMTAVAAIFPWNVNWLKYDAAPGFVANNGLQLIFSTGTPEFDASFLKSLSNSRKVVGVLTSILTKMLKKMPMSSGGWKVWEVGLAGRGDASYEFPMKWILPKMQCVCVANIFHWFMVDPILFKWW